MFDFHNIYLLTIAFILAFIYNNPLELLGTNESVVEYKITWIIRLYLVYHAPNIFLYPIYAILLKRYGIFMTLLP
jgi:hypothetical protein